MDSQFIQQFENMKAGLSDAPSMAYALPAIGLVAGMVLWLSGAKVLKGLFVLAGCGAGALVGVTQAGTWIPAGVLGVPPALAGVVIGLVLGLLLSAIVFRFAMAAAGASMAAIASVGCAAMWLSQTPDSLPPWPTGAEPSALTTEEGTVLVPHSPGMSIRVRERDESPGSEGVPSEVAPAQTAHGAGQLELPESVLRTVATMQGNAQRFADDAKLWWASAPGETRTTMFWAGTFGGLAGLLVGLVSPKKSAAVLTAFAGSAVALLAGGAMAREAHWAPGFAANWTTLHWAGVWAAAAALGAMIQTSRTRAPAKTKAPVAAA